MNDNNNKNNGLISNKNNGLITKIWGPPAWTFLHCVTFGYPIEPTEENKEKFKMFFELVGDILPCKYCRESYKEFISQERTRLTDDVMQNRDTLTKWFYDIHNEVNNKLDTVYGVKYEDVVKRYEAYRATCSKKPANQPKGCIVPLNKKAQCYKVASITDCPIVPVSVVKQFIEYAKKRGIDTTQYIDEINTNQDLDKMLNNKSCGVWCKRNKECRDIITKMRVEGIPSVESKGPYSGLPTPEELKLILRFSSNLSPDELDKIGQKLNKSINNKKGRKVYRLVKSN